MKKRIAYTILLLTLMLMSYQLASNYLTEKKYGHFEQIADMKVPRAGHKSFLMSDGNVLIVGGDKNNTIEVFNPKNNTFTLKKGLGKKFDINICNVVLLKNDKLLVTGGASKNNAYNSAYIYDSTLDRMSKISSMNRGRDSHSSVLLNDGRVVVFGGYTGKIGEDWYNKTAEIYDPRKNRFTLLKDSPHFIYIGNTKTALLKDGNVLISTSSTENNKTEIFNLKTNKFEVIGYVNYLIKLDSDCFFVIDENASSNLQMIIFKLDKNYKSQTIKSVDLKQNRVASSCVISLTNNTVLFTGGIRGVEGLILWDTADSFIYDLNINKLIKIKNMYISRFQHNCIKINDHEVLITGGYTQKTPFEGGHARDLTNKAEIFSYKVSK